MDYNSIILILGLFWWVLCACAIVCLFAWMYIQLTYMKWNREDRERENIIQQVHDEIEKTLEEVKDEDCSDFVM